MSPLDQPISEFNLACTYTLYNPNEQEHSCGEPAVSAVREISGRLGHRCHRHHGLVYGGVTGEIIDSLPPPTGV